MEGRGTGGEGLVVLGPRRRSRVVALGPHSRLHVVVLGPHLLVSLALCCRPRVAIRCSSSVVRWGASGGREGKRGEQGVGGKEGGSERWGCVLGPRCRSRVLGPCRHTCVLGPHHRSRVLGPHCHSCMLVLGPCQVVIRCVHLAGRLWVVVVVAAFASLLSIVMVARMVDACRGWCWATVAICGGGGCWVLVTGRVPALLCGVGALLWPFVDAGWRGTSSCYFHI